MGAQWAPDANHEVERQYREEDITFQKLDATFDCLHHHGQRLRGETDTGRITYQESGNTNVMVLA